MLILLVVVQQLDRILAAHEIDRHVALESKMREISSTRVGDSATDIEEDVVASAAVEQVIAGAAQDNVVAIAAVDRVVAVVEGVRRSAAAIDGIVAIATID